MTYAVVRIRGHVNIRAQTRDTLRYLRLHRANHCVFLPQDETVEGMLQVAKDYITWGEVDAPTVERLLAARGRANGGKAIDNAFVKGATEFPTLKALALSIAKGDADLRDVEGAKPVLRLHPPKGGFEGVKRAFAAGGALGYRGPAINDLLKRMLGTEGT